MAGAIVCRPLTDVELAWADQVAWDRNDHAIRDGRRDQLMRRSSGLWQNLIGAMGELATAIYLRVPWSATVDTFTSVPDVLPDLEIRTTDGANRKLRIHPKETADPILQRRRYVLVWAVDFSFSIHGWIRPIDVPALGLPLVDLSDGVAPEQYWIPARLLNDLGPAEPIQLGIWQ